MFLICWQGIFVTFQARASEHVLVIYLFPCQKEQMMLITAMMEESIQKVHMAFDEGMLDSILTSRVLLLSQLPAGMHLIYLCFFTQQRTRYASSLAVAFLISFSI